MGGEISKSEIIKRLFDMQSQQPSETQKSLWRTQNSHRFQQWNRPPGGLHRASVQTAPAPVQTVQVVEPSFIHFKPGLFSSHLLPPPILFILHPPISSFTNPPHPTPPHHTLHTPPHPPHLTLSPPPHSTSISSYSGLSKGQLKRHF